MNKDKVLEALSRRYDMEGDDIFDEAITIINSQSAEIERLRPLAKIGERWNADSSLEEWFPYTAEELSSLRQKVAELEKCAGFNADGLVREMALQAKVAELETKVSGNE